MLLVVLLICALLWRVHSSLEYSIVRDTERPCGFRSDVESDLLRSSAPITSIFTSNNAEFLFVCSSMYLFAYKVHTYPNEYPNWPYLFYGSMLLVDSLSSTDVRVTKCELRKLTADRYIFVSFSDGKTRILEMQSLSEMSTNGFSSDVSGSSREEFVPVVHESEVKEIWTWKDFGSEEDRHGIMGVRGYGCCRWWVAGCRVNDLCPKISEKFRNETFRSWEEKQLSATFLETHELVPGKPLVAQNLFFASSHSGDSEVKIRVGSQRLSIRFGSEIVSIDSFHFEHRFLCVGFKNGMWKMIKFGEKTRGPNARLSSFYLEPRPVKSTRRTDYFDPRMILLTFLALEIAIGFSLVVGPVAHRAIAVFSPIVSMRLVVRAYAVFSFLFSCYEILCQPVFLMDFPAHIQFAEQFVRERTFDYSSFMHFHGPCPYGGVFLFLYGFLYLIAGKTVAVFQVIWVVLEMANFFALGEIGELIGVDDPVVMLLCLGSNRLHLYNVRVVVNDFPAVVAMNWLIVFLLRRFRKTEVLSLVSWSSVCVMYAFTLAYKLNFVLFLPALLLLPLVGRRLIRGIFHSLFGLALIVATQIVLAIPFVAFGGGFGYFRFVYNLSRLLLWEKSRYFKFVGLSIFNSTAFQLVCLCCSACMIGTLALGFVVFHRKKRADSLQRIVFAVIAGTNFLFLTFAKGMYTPFLCWYFYTLPLLMANTAGMPTSTVLLIWSLHEVFFRFWHSDEIEKFGSLILFCTNVFVSLAVLRGVWRSQEAEKRDDSKENSPKESARISGCLETETGLYSRK